MFVATFVRFECFILLVFSLSLLFTWTNSRSLFLFEMHDARSVLRFSITFYWKERQRNTSNGARCTSATNNSKSLWLIKFWRVSFSCRFIYCISATVNIRSQLSIRIQWYEDHVKLQRRDDISLPASQFLISIGTKNKPHSITATRFESERRTIFFRWRCQFSLYEIYRTRSMNHI